MNTMLNYTVKRLVKLSKYYYEKSGLLDAEINITYHEVFQKNDEELGVWIDSVRQYIVNEWDEKGIPPAIG